MEHTGSLLRALVEPQSIAIIGATERPSISRSIVETLGRLGYPGKIYPINPRYSELFGMPCYSSVSDVPAAPDVVAFCIGGEHLFANLPLLAERGAKAAVIYDGGFAERGEEGQKLQEKISAICKEAGIALCGPNCMGILNPVARSSTYLATLRDPTGLAGNVGLVSQSGSICNGMLADVRRFAFSLIVSSGNEASLSTAAYLEYLIDDPATKVIATFTETIREPDRFIAALDRAADVGKPVVVLKVGRSERSRRAIHSHTGGLAGESRVFSEVLKAHRAMEVNDLDELSEVLAVCQGSRRPRGRNIGVTAGSGGVTELVLDVVSSTQIQLPPLSAEDRAKAESVIGSITGDGNPLDYWGNGDFQKNLPHALATLGASPTYDAVVYCLDSHDDQPMVPHDRLMGYVRMLATAAATSDKPHYMLNMRPGVMHRDQIAFLRQHGIPVIGGSRQGLGAVGSVGSALAILPPVRRSPDRPAVLEKGRGSINEYESKQLLGSYGLSVAKERLVFTLDEAQAAAAEIGYPTVLKVASDSIPHKSEYGLVVLGIGDADEMTGAWGTLDRRLKEADLYSNSTGFVVQEFVKAGVEVFAGISRDPDFGLSIAFGMGGIGIEIFKDFSLRMLPLRDGDVEAMIAETKVAALLKAHRGQPAADYGSLVDCLYRLSDFAMSEADRLAEIDLNPIKVLPAGMGYRIVDALIVTL